MYVGHIADCGCVGHIDLDTGFIYRSILFSLDQLFIWLIDTDYSSQTDGSESAEVERHSHHVFPHPDSRVQPRRHDKRLLYQHRWVRVVGAPLPNA